MINNSLYYSISKLNSLFDQKKMSETTKYIIKNIIFNILTCLSLILLVKHMENEIPFILGVYAQVLAEINSDIIVAAKVITQELNVFNKETAIKVTNKGGLTLQQAKLVVKYCL